MKSRKPTVTGKGRPEMPEQAKSAMGRIPAQAKSAMSRLPEQAKAHGVRGTTPTRPEMPQQARNARASAPASHGKAVSTQARSGAGGKAVSTLARSGGKAAPARGYDKSVTALGKASLSKGTKRSGPRGR